MEGGDQGLMATIDDKVVAMSFESSKFEQGVNRAIAALDKLKSSLKFEHIGKGLDAIQSSMNKFNLGQVSKSVDDVSHRLEALRLVAISVLGQLAAQATRAAGRFLKAFTIDPIIQGFNEYATNLNSIQTVLANTQAAGTSLDDVNKALQDLNRYSDKTIYNFGQMARNIGTFTAAGVDLQTSTAAIKGIANLAALSGSNAEQASTAMYQLSQAISTGRVSLQDWNSVVNAGMGGTVFQRALATTAEAMGTLKKGAVELQGPMKNVSINGESFRESIGGPGPKWLTSKVLTTTLQQFTGDLKDSELAALGFNEAQIKSIQLTAKTAMHAATEVKTISQVFDVAKETAGSGWAQTFQIIFGNFAEAKTTFTALSNAINGFINTNSDARNKVLADWKALGGRTILIDGIKTAFKNLGEIIKPIKEAFRDVFPAATGKSLLSLTKGFHDFAEALKPSQATVEGLKSTFRGLFAFLDIGKQIISGILAMFGKMFGAIGDGSGGFLKITGSIGDFIFALDQSLKKGQGITKFFESLGTVLAKPIELLGKMANAIGDLFSQFSSGGFAGQIDGMSNALSPFSRILENVAKAWDNFVNSLKDSQAVDDAIQGILAAITGLGQALGNAASNMNFEAILAVIRTGLLGGIVLMLKNFFGKGSLLDQIGKGFAGGIMANISGAFKTLNGTMTSFQNNIKAKTLKEIAIAIALLAASIVALSLVDPKKVNSSLAAIGIMMGELLGAMAILDKIAKTGGFLRLPIIAAGLIVLAGAVDLLVIAVMALSRLSWSELLKGLGGVAALLASLSAAAIPLSANSAGMIRSGIAIGLIAVAMNILALAVKQFGGMDLASLGKGLGSVAAGLGILAASMKVMPTGMIAQSIALIALGTGLNILAKAVGQFAGMNWGSIAKGMASIGGALVIIAGAMRIMPKGMVLQAAALILVATALGKIASAVEKMGGMSITAIAKGIGTLAASLGVLAAGLYLMEGALPGAAALATAAVGISLLSTALVRMGGMSWTSMIKSLVMLAAALAVIGVAGLLLTPVVPALLGFGAALFLIGAGLALAGAGIFLIATGISALVVAVPTGVGVIIAAIVSLQKGIIENAKLIAEAVLSVVEAIAEIAPKVVDAAIKIVKALLDGITKAAPMVAPAVTALIDMIINVLQQNQAKIIAAGLNLLIALLTGIRNAIPQLVTLVVDIIVRFLNAVAANLGRIVTAGTTILAAFIRGILQNIANIVTMVTTIFTRFLDAIGNNLAKIATAGISIMTKLVTAIGSKMSDIVKAGTNAVVEFVTAIGNAGSRIVRAGVEAAGKFMNTLAEEIPKLVDKAYKALIKFINGMADTIENNTGPLRSAGQHLAFELINGMTMGLAQKGVDAVNKAKDIASDVLGALGGVLGIGSPSKETMWMGGMLMQGLTQGMDKNAYLAYNSAIALSKEVIQKFNDVFQTASPSKVMMEIGQYVGQGFAHGLRGSQDDIRGAFTELNNKLTEAMRTARETIVTEQKKLDELRDAKKPDLKAIAEVQKVIDQNQELLSKSMAGHKLLTGTLRDEKAELISLSNEFITTSEKLDKAKDVLANAIKTRDDAIKGWRDQYASLPDIVTKDAEGNSIDALATYMEALKNQADAVGAYQSTLKQLRQLGLDDATYQKLLAEGTADQEFATQLLAGGKTAVQGLNTLDKQLTVEADKLAKQGAKNLYQAGVDSAAGLVKGLTSQKQRLINEIEAMADEIVAAFNRRLQVKSPSKVFAEIGRFIMLGLAQGITNSTKMVADSLDIAAQKAVDAMKSSMSNISDVVASHLDVNPVITPVLDLTQVRTQAQELGALTRVTPITAAASYGQASLISTAQQAAQGDQESAMVGGTNIKFEQNNYSPESLTEIEIYRQTKNQLSMLKSALEV
jgi:tape measure domain-containing protein